MKIVPHEKIGESVLIAEDHTRTREALRVIFERKSHHVTEAKNYRDAIAALEDAANDALDFHQLFASMSS